MWPRGCGWGEGGESQKLKKNVFFFQISKIVLMAKKIKCKKGVARGGRERGRTGGVKKNKKSLFFLSLWQKT